VRHHRIAAIVLAAGRSIRMGSNKLLIEIGGKSLVEHAVDTALVSRASPVVVVTGHQPAMVEARLAGRDVILRRNPDYAAGLATSLRAGLAAVPDECDGIVVCLADMPGVGPALIDALIDAYDPSAGREIVVPTRDGQRGNPILWGRRLMPELAALQGDSGGRQIIDRHAAAIFPVAVADDAASTDIDTPEALSAWFARQPFST
jgi:molybdenum cofactor cytidylyltransferase